MANKGYKITQAVKDRLEKARKSIKPKVKNPNALKPNDPKYKHHKKESRRRNTDMRNKCRNKNYAQSRPSVRNNKPWGILEMTSIINSPLSDRELAKSLGRSVQAIQTKRYCLRLNALREYKKQRSII